MKGDERAVIRSLPSGVPGLDTVLAGGLPEFSFNLIAGGPGSGKTILAHQIMFANATAKKPALYFTVLGEPTLKMLRYQQQFTFFDSALVGSAVQFINLSAEVMERDLAEVLRRIASETERVNPGIVIVDSFRTIRAQYGTADVAATLELDQFVQRLAMNLTTWEVTSLLLGEYTEEEQRNPVFTVADGILWLSQATDRNSVVRKLQIEVVACDRGGARATIRCFSLTLPTLDETARDLSGRQPVFTWIDRAHSRPSRSGSALAAQKRTSSRGA